MIGRLFLVLVLLAVSFYVVKYLRTKLDDAQKRLKEGDNDTVENKQNTKNIMLKCQHCGLHIPEKEAIKQGDNVFCSLEHAQQEL